MNSSIFDPSSEVSDFGPGALVVLAGAVETAGATAAACSAGGPDPVVVSLGASSASAVAGSASYERLGAPTWARPGSQTDLGYVHPPRQRNMAAASPLDREEPVTPSTLRRRLRALQRVDRFVRLERALPGDPRANGFVCGLGRALVAIEQYHDFSCEGHRAFALDAIESIRADARERHMERIVRAERLRPRRLTVPARALESWTALVAWLRRRGKNVIIQCEGQENFYIGRIERVDEHEVLFANFDSLGRWDSAPRCFAVGEITSVEFGTPYIELMSRHLAAP